MEREHSKEEKRSMERFTILITHRLGAARMADEILVDVKEAEPAPVSYAGPQRKNQFLY